MTDADLLASIQDYLGVTKPGLEHIVTCDDCSITGSLYEGGPDYCLAYRIEFEGYVPPPPRSDGGAFAPTAWTKVILAALEKQITYGSS